MDWFDRDRYEILLDQADAELQARRPEAAEHLATQAIDLAPDVHDAWQMRACIRIDLNELELARTDANRALQLGAGGEAFIARARIEYELQEFEPAARDLEEGMADGINDADVLNLRGLIQLALEQPLQAAESFRHACQKMPNEPEFELNRGNALLHLNEPGRALDVYSGVLKRFPDNAEARYRRGGLLLDTGYVTLAVSEFCEAAKLRSDDPEYHWAYGTALEAESNFDDAEEAYSAALRIAPDDVVYRETRAHFRLTRRGDFRGALEDYDRLIREHEQHADYFAARAAVYLAIGNTEAADADLAAAARRNPDGLAGAIQRMIADDQSDD